MLTVKNTIMKYITKASVNILLFVCFSNLIYGQIKQGKNYFNPSIQPSSELHFKYAYSVAYSMYTVQPFTFKATNVSGKGIRAKFELVALTMCNTEVVAEFDIVFQPNESKGF